MNIMSFSLSCRKCCYRSSSSRIKVVFWHRIINIKLLIVNIGRKLWLKLCIYLSITLFLTCLSSFYVKTGKWSEEEERRLAEVVYDMAGVTPGSAVTGGVSWATVADQVRTRSEKQCRSKWLNYLNWKHSGGTEWMKDDDLNLIRRFVYFICVHS